MPKREITLYLEEPRYDALQQALQLRGSDVETEMQKRLEQCCHDFASAQKREEIAGIPKTTSRSFLQLTAQGETHCFQLDGEEADTPEMAAHLTRFLAQPPNTAPDRFEEVFTNPESVTKYEFTLHVFECLAYAEHITGVFDVDLDNGTFSILDTDIGWRTFTAADICGLSRRLEECGITDKAQLDAVFCDLPYSKQAANPDRLSFLGGSRAIEAEEITICECLVEHDDGVIIFMVDVLADEREAFGAELFTDEDSYFVFHAVYDTNTNQVSNKLELSLMRPAETIEYVCPLPPKTVEGLRQKMDDYCVAWCGRHLAELGNQEPPTPEAPFLGQHM